MTDFLIRKVPEELHLQWTHFAKKGGHKMRKYVLIALKRQVERDKDGDKNGRSQKYDEG